MTQLHWRQTSRSTHVADLPNGARYTINRWEGRWVIFHLPTGAGEGGHERIHCDGSLADAKTACWHHAFHAGVLS